MPLVLPPNLTSKLQAVNTLLASIGEAPVSSVETSEAVDVAAAVSALDEVLGALLDETWHWNTNYQVTLTPDEDGNIALPVDCRSIEEAYWGGCYGITPAPFAERSRKLYNTKLNTFAFTGTVEVDYHVSLGWEDIPEYARRYVTIRGCQLFQARIEGTRIVMEVQASEVNSARATLEQREDRANPLNQVTGNRQQLNRVYGRGRRRLG